MKRILFISLFSLFYCSVGVSEPMPTGYITYEEYVVRMHENALERLLLAIRITESGLNDFAVGSALDVGPLQITPIRLADYNQKTGKNYSHSDCFNWEVSREIFLYYAHQIGISQDNWEEISRRWNRAYEWEDEKGAAYWRKVTKHLNKIV